MIYYGHQHITEKDIQAVEKVLRSNYLTQGPVIESFEKKGGIISLCGGIPSLLSSLIIPWQPYINIGAA